MTLQLPAPTAAPDTPAKLRPLVVGFLGILLIGFLDYHTGPQVSASFFYLLPVLFVTRFAGRAAGLAAALFATGIWFSADLMPPAAYSGLWIPSWNAVMRLGVFVVAVLLVAAMRGLAETLERRVEQRTAQLHAESAERRELEKRILEISEREQARIGQDLHDGLCQHLVGTAFAANLLQQKLADQDRPEAAEAAKIAGLLDESITQARQLARGLYPVRLEELGLVTALSEMTGNLGEMFRHECGFEFRGEDIDVEQPVAVHLYRIAQEALTNAVRHGRPRHVSLGLRRDADGIELRIEDDGVGIAGKPQGEGGLGLRIMEYRARMLGGSFSIEPRRDGGTVVTCIVPNP